MRSSPPIPASKEKKNIPRQPFFMALLITSIFSFMKIREIRRTSCFARCFAKFARVRAPACHCVKYNQIHTAIPGPAAAERLLVKIVILTTSPILFEQFKFH